MDQQQPQNGIAKEASPPPKRPRVFRSVLLILVVAMIVIQFVPVARTSPPATGAINVPPEVQAVLQRSCYDCHSHETVWPWYSYVAPVSWLVAHDVNEGREHVNFSTWNSYGPEEQADIKREAWEEVEEGEMPLGIYLALHSEAKLTEQDKNLIRDWASGTDGAED